MKLEKKGKNVSCLARVGEVRRAMFSQKAIFVLVYKEGCLVSNDNNLSLPSMFQYLLQKFDDVFQDEVPKELPPIKGIEHKIDFIPGAVIPNKPAYRANPTETQEIRRQVEELMEKGYIRESLSPYSIRDLLMSNKDETWGICMDNRVINKITVIVT